MSKVAFSIKSYSFYLFFMGALLVVVPDLLLRLLGFEPTNEIWIRLLGTITFVLGIYYFYTSLYEQTAFYKATIAGRLFFFATTVSITFLFNQPLTLALVGSADLIGALWTFSSLKNNPVIK